MMLEDLFKRERLSARRLRKRLTRKKVLEERNERLAVLRLQAEIVRAPEWFYLLKNNARNGVLGFLRELRDMAAAAPRITIDFRGTRKMDAGGTILFYAELHRLQALFPHVRFGCLPSRTNKVNQVLQHLEIFRQLGHQSSVTPRLPDVVSWRHASANLVDCKSAGKVIEAYESLSHPNAKLLYRACSEAITNVLMHAYEDDRDDGLPTPGEKRWWMFCREDSDALTMMVCDLGIGIPRSLPAKHAGEALGKIVSAITGGAIANDASMIEAAFELARTRTQREHQGKGLSDLRKIIDANNGARLLLFSNKGLVIIDSGGQPVKYGFTDSILGTVIGWRLPLESIGPTDAQQVVL